MIANEKPELLEAAESLYEYNNEDTIRFQCYAREDYRKKMNRIDRDLKRLKELETENSELTSHNLDLTSQVSAQASKISAQASQIAEQNSQIAELLAEIERLKNKK